MLQSSCFNPLETGECSDNIHAVIYLLYPLTTLYIYNEETCVQDFLQISYELFYDFLKRGSKTNFIYCINRQYTPKRSSYYTGTYINIT